MANGRKTRCDRWDAKARLTEDQVWRAYDVFGRSHWVEFLAWAGNELPGVKIPSRNSMYEWYDDLESKEAAHRVKQAVDARKEIGELAETAALDAELVSAYKSMGAKAALLGNKAEAVALTKMALGLAGQQVESEKVRLQRDRFEFDAAKKAMEKAALIKGIMADSSMDDDAKILKVRQALFGEVPQ
jgi:hypothetical protein